MTNLSREIETVERLVLVDAYCSYHKDSGRRRDLMLIFTAARALGCTDRIMEITSPKSLDYRLMLPGHAGKTNVITAEKISALTCGFWVHYFNHIGEEMGKLIQKLLHNQEVHGLPSSCLLQYFSYKVLQNDSCWSADLKSKATEDIISIGSFMEVLVLNQYILVRKNIFIIVTYAWSRIGKLYSLEAYGL
ncbi:hypothetical protein Tco_1499553 [Tanacetum coccineum]